MLLSMRQKINYAENLKVFSCWFFIFCQIKQDVIKLETFLLIFHQKIIPFDAKLKETLFCIMPDVFSINQIPKRNYTCQAASGTVRSSSSSGTEYLITILPRN